jgi:hypothetical protein
MFNLIIKLWHFYRPTNIVPLCHRWLPPLLRATSLLAVDALEESDRPIAETVLQHLILENSVWFSICLPNNNFKKNIPEVTNL